MIDYKLVLLQGIFQAGIPANKIFMKRNKINVDNCSLTFTYGKNGIYYHKTFEDVIAFHTAEEVCECIREWHKENAAQ